MDRPIKIIETMPRRWDGHDYEAVLTYEYHWADGSTTTTTSCPSEEDLALIVDGDRLPSSAQVGKALSGLLAEIARG